MNILYRTPNTADWVGVAEKLQMDHGWKATYWLANPKLANEVEKAFPNVVFHSTHKANRNLPPAANIEIDPKPLDKEVLDQYRSYRPFILRLMGRMDPGHAYSYDERVRSYHNLLRYWLSAIESHEIDIAVFGRIPHSPSGYIIYAICREKNIPTPMFKPIHHIPEITIIQGNVFGINKELADFSSDKFENVDPENVLDSSKQAMEKLTGEYTEPSYTDRRYFPYLSKIKNVSEYPYYLRKLSKRASTLKKVRGKRIENSEITLARHILERQFARVKKRRLRRSYEKISTQPNHSSDYIYVPLHYQPERTTVPDGHVFGNQFLMIDLLSKTIPDGWELFVKEHPTQFSPNMKGERGRSTYDYEDIRSLDNTVLVDYGADSFELIDNSKAVVTVTGTAGWESVVRGKPSIVFGNAWYRPCPGVHYVTTIEEVEAAIESIQENPTVSQDDVLRFVRAIEVAGFHGYQSSNWADADRISSEENITNISNELYEFVDCCE